MQSSQYGYIFEQETGETTITEITASSDNVKVNQNENTEVTITPNNVVANYVKIKGSYHQFIYNGSSKIELGAGRASIPQNDNSEFEISSLSVEPSSGVVNVSKNGDKVTIAGVRHGTATITVTYTDSTTSPTRNVTTDINVTVKGLVQVTVVADDTGYGTVSKPNATGTAVSKLEGETVELEAEVTDTTANQFIGWFDEDNTKISGDLVCLYTVPSDENYKSSKTITAKFEEKPKILGTTASDSGVGYYINKGTDDSPEYAIIFADRVVQAGTTVVWSSMANSSCTFPILDDNEKTTLFKTYKINGTYSDSKFGTKNVLEVDSDIGEDRFMAIALKNLKVGVGGYAWYNAAYGHKMLDYNASGDDGKGSPTSKGFLKGKTNTETMITKWNNKSYGNQDTGKRYGKWMDIWGEVQNQYLQGWFVPSFEEWSAFSWAVSQGKLKSGTSNYRELGLSDRYWSSSQSGDERAYQAYLSGGICTVLM